MLCHLIRKGYYKNLETSVITSPLSPPSLIKALELQIPSLLYGTTFRVYGTFTPPGVQGDRTMENIFILKPFFLCIIYCFKLSKKRWKCRLYSCDFHVLLSLISLYSQDAILSLTVWPSVCQTVILIWDYLFIISLSVCPTIWQYEMFWVLIF